MEDRREWLVGTHVFSDDGSEWGLSIELGPEGFTVRSWDETDGEEFVISDLRWDGQRLSFESLTPSVGWRTKKSFRPISPTDIEQELTYWEPWIPVENEPGDSATNPDDPRDWLIGEWVVADDSGSGVVQVRRTSEDWEVRARDRDTGEEFALSEICWDGERLCFESILPSNQFRSRHALKPISVREIEHETTYWITWNEKQPPARSARRLPFP